MASDSQQIMASKFSDNWLLTDDWQYLVTDVCRQLLPTVKRQLVKGHQLLIFNINSCYTELGLGLLMKGYTYTYKFGKMRRLAFNTCRQIKEICRSSAYAEYETPKGSLQMVVVVLLFYVHGKHLRSCWDGQLT